jgi:hypothetical protein
MAEEVKPDLPGESWVLEVHGTHYPTVNAKLSSWNPLINDIRRNIANFNPFAYRQIPSQDRSAFGLRYGGHFFVPDVYPNGVYFNKMFPTHYNPLEAESRPAASWQIIDYAPAPHSHYAFTADALPKGCMRTVQNYKRCVMVNGKDKCEEESNDIIEICPNWALEGMKEAKRTWSKVEAIQNLQYHEAMRISPYNVGRTPKDVSDKTWIHGTRQYLRPDTMWADERYSKITQVEINEAKKRIADKEAHKAHHDGSHHKKDHGHHDDHKHGGVSHDHGHGHYDFKHAAVKQPRPLYP